MGGGKSRRKERGGPGERRKERRKKGGDMRCDALSVSVPVAKEGERRKENRKTRGNQTKEKMLERAIRSGLEGLRCTVPGSLHPRRARSLTRTASTAGGEGAFIVGRVGHTWARQCLSRSRATCETGEEETSSSSKPGTGSQQLAAAPPMRMSVSLHAGMSGCLCICVSGCLGV